MFAPDEMKSGRTDTRLMEPPKKKKPEPKENEQVPAGDDTDINEGRDFIQPEDVRDDRPKAKPKKEKQPVEKETGGDENTGCAC
jgi:hypothetical protein